MLGVQLAVQQRPLPSAEGSLQGLPEAAVERRAAHVPRVQRAARLLRPVRQGRFCFRLSGSQRLV